MGASVDIYNLVERSTTTIEELLAQAEADSEDPDDVVQAVYLADRKDLLEKLVEVPEYAEEAQKELNAMIWMENSRKAWQEKVAAYPEVFKRWREVLTKCRKVGIYDVNYPSAQGGENTVAISGDGLYLFHFEILSMEGEGEFKIAPHPTGKDYAGRPCPPSSDSEVFRTMGGHEFGDAISGTRVLHILTGMYG